MQNTWNPDKTLRLSLILIVFLLVSLAAWLGVHTGWTIDNDTFALQDSFRSILEGNYRPSRTSGYPLYEFIGAFTWSVGGYTATAWLSTAFTLTALILLIRPTRALSSWIGLVAWIFLALTPTVLTNSSAVMETALLFLVVALVAIILSSPATWNRWGIAGLVGAGFCLVATRPDSVLVAIATSVAFLGTRTHPLTMRLSRIAALGAGSLLGLGWIMLLTSRLPLSGSYIPDDAALRRFLRGGVGIVTVFGPAGAVALVALVVTLIVIGISLLQTKQPFLARPDAAPLNSPGFVVTWTLSAIVLYLLRFLALADEIEYLLPLLVILAVVASSLWATNRLASVLTLVALGSSALTSVFTIAFLDRSDPWQPEPSIRLSIQSGAWFQDVKARTASGIRTQDAYRDFLDESLGELKSDVDAGNAALMPRDSWHFVRNAGYREYYDDIDAIVSCDVLQTETLIPGWRVSQPAGDYQDIVQFRAGVPMECSVVATLLNETVTPVGAGVTDITNAPFAR